MQVESLIAPESERPDHQVAVMQMRVMLLHVMDQIPRRQCEVIVAKYWLGKSSADLAAFLNISEPAVSQLHRRALSSLRDRLAAMSIKGLKDCY